jgi:hypothetical protein
VAQATINPRTRAAFATLEPDALVIVLGAPSWLSDSPYLKASKTAGLFCDNAVGALVLLCRWLWCDCRWCTPALRLVTFGVLRGPDAEFGRTRALGAAASDGDTAITAGGTIAAAEATCRALCWGAVGKFPTGSSKTNTWYRLRIWGQEFESLRARQYLALRLETCWKRRFHRVFFFAWRNATRGASGGLDPPQM